MTSRKLVLYMGGLLVIGCATTTELVAIEDPSAPKVKEAPPAVKPPSAAEQFARSFKERFPTAPATLTLGPGDVQYEQPIAAEKVTLADGTRLRCAAGKAMAIDAVEVVWAGKVEILCSGSAGAAGQDAAAPAAPVCIGSDKKNAKKEYEGIEMKPGAPGGDGKFGANGDDVEIIAFRHTLAAGASVTVLSKGGDPGKGGKGAAGKKRMLVKKAKDCTAGTNVVSQETAPSGPDGKPGVEAYGGRVHVKSSTPVDAARFVIDAGKKDWEAGQASLD